jgi:DNA repair exonuclease SbcCD ATPase subunit
LNTLSSDYAELENQSAHWAPVTTLNTGQKKSKRTFLVALSLLSATTAITGLVLSYLILSAVFGISALVVAYLATRTNKLKVPIEVLPDDLNLKSSGNPLYGLISSKKNEIDKKNSAIIELDDEISEKLFSLGFATNGGDFHSALSKYIFETQNSDVRKKRQEMEDLLGRAKEAENEIVASRLRNGEILTNLRRVSSICGLEDSLTANGDVLVAGLKAWLDDRDSQRIKASDAKASWVMRETILHGRTLAEMQEELEGHRSGIDHRLLTTYEVVNHEKSIALLKRLREEESTASNIAASARGQLKALANSNISVADCEQELQEANVELERVEKLAEILDKTSEFLEAAQTKVHRDVAPILEAAICAQLPTITSGRYSRAKVDPQDLSVQIDVSNGRFEDANSLSYGTTEQIYLLLRIALLDYLTSSNESCPIICDDLTVHADSERTTGILRLLKEISQKRQVIMFSQEAEVFAWGKKNLTDTCEQVMVLQT